MSKEEMGVNAEFQCLTCGGCTKHTDCRYRACSCKEVGRILREAAAKVDVKDYEMKQSILEEAQRVVFGPRQGVYGHPRDDFQRAVRLWNAYLIGRGVTEGRLLDTQDIGALMILLKMARLMETPDHRDSIVDIAGYAETMARVRGIDD